MNETARALTVRAHTIGQTPRPDLADELKARLGSVRVEVRGALDGLTRDQLPDHPDHGYPLETRLRDGRRVVLDAAYLQPRIQDSISDGDDRAMIHFILCAGLFPGLRSIGRVIQPFEVAAGHLAAAGIESIDAVVPFAAQVRPALRKWQAAGFCCRAHTLTEGPDDASRASRLVGRLAATTSGAIVFDYVGLPATLLQAVATRLEVPVFDVGHLATEALESEVEHRGGIGK